MKNKFTRLVVTAALMAAFVALGQSAAKPDKKIEVQLLWGTDAAKSPNPAHKPVEAEIKKKLKDLPLKWTNYFMVKKMVMLVPRGSITKQPISEKCAIEVKDLGKTMLEISYFGKDKKVEKRTQSLPRGEV